MDMAGGWGILDSCPGDGSTRSVEGDGSVGHGQAALGTRSWGRTARDGRNGRWMVFVLNLAPLELDGEERKWAKH